MQIKRLVIENFKSIERIELIEPNPFTVFVGPNGSGKSNIFEALEFIVLSADIPFDLVVSLFGGQDSFGRRVSMADETALFVELSSSFTLRFSYTNGTSSGRNYRSDDPKQDDSQAAQFQNFTRLFIGNDRLVKFKLTDDKRLSLSGGNMETVLKRLLTDDVLKEEIHEWLSLFIPGFRSVEVVSGTFDSKDTLLVYEQTVDKPFTKNFISDGTYNIIALLTAVYQSAEPQFLCIEEPENGLHPEVLLSLIEFFRKQCQEKGHYIWMNTHSETVVRLLTTDEIILVDKRDGATQTKQVKGMNTYSLTTDEAWLTGALGGGLAW